MPQRFDVIIPHYGCSERLDALALACLRSVVDHSHDYRVIFVNNGSTRASPEMERLLTGLYGAGLVYFINNSTNLGFVRAVNQGLAVSVAERVVLLNNDTEVGPYWLDKLDAAIAAFSSVGAAGPLTTSRESWQGRTSAGNSPVLLPTYAMLAFFCTMFRREVFAKVGLLDESYSPGLGDDDDFCRRMHKAGYRLALARDLVVKHHHRSTFKELYSGNDIAAMQQQAMNRFHRSA